MTAQQFQVHQSPSELEIKLVAINRSVFWTGWLIMLLWFVIVSAHTFLQMNRSPWILLFLAIWAAVIAAILIMGIYGLIWSLTGKEAVRIADQELHYERTCWRVDDRRVRIPLSEISNISVRSPVGDSLRTPHVRLRHKAGSLSFGTDLDNRTAREIVEILRRHVSGRGTPVR